MPMATKPDKVVTYHMGLPPIKSHDTLAKWSWKITCQTKVIVSLLSECLWSPNLVEW